MNIQGTINTQSLGSALGLQGEKLCVSARPQKKQQSIVHSKAYSSAYLHVPGMSPPSSVRATCS